MPELSEIEDAWAEALEAGWDDAPDAPVPVAELLVGAPSAVPEPCELEALDPDLARLKIGATADAPQATSVTAVWFRESATGPALIVPAIAGWAEARGDAKHCEVFFADAEGVEALCRGDAAPPQLDRRRAVRYAPAADEPVEVYLRTTADDDGVPVRVIDISAGGLCVELLVDLEPETPFTWCGIELLLPDEAWPMLLVGRMRHRVRRSRAHVRFGFEFDPEQTDDFDAQTRRIGAWVAARQKELVARLPWFAGD